MKEININIEGYNVNGICVGCLNYNRKMYYVDDVKECFKLLANIDVPDGLTIQVCWECLAAVRNVSRFQMQILNAYDVLIEYSNKHTFLNSPKDFTVHATTRLAINNVFNTDFTLTVEQIKQENQESKIGEIDIIKESNEEEDLKIKHEFPLDIEEDDINDIGFNDNVTSEDDVTLSKLKSVSEDTQKIKKKKRGEKKKSKGKKKDDIGFKEIPITEEEMWKYRKQDLLEESFARLKFKCEDCILSFKAKKLMEEHMIKKHQPKGENSIQCPICRAFFLTKEHLSRHVSRHARGFSCLSCGHVAGARAAAAAHAGGHKDTLRCGSCGDSFSTKSKLSYHRATCQQERPQCVCCGKVFANKLTLKYHLKVLPAKTDKPKENVVIPCKGCDKVFYSKKSYRAHVVIHDGLQYHCPVCSKPFQWKRNLSRHLRNHRDRDNGSLHECKQCGKRFSSRDCYNNHMRFSKRHVVEEALSHSCSYCGKRFATKWCLVDHVDWEHLDRVKYRCSVCDKAFKTAKIMVAHMNNIHGGGSKKEPDGAHLCDICGKSYKTDKRLKGHVWAMHKRRSTEKSYKCTQCPATFTWQTSIYKHMKMMHDKRGGKQQKPQPTKKQEQFPSIDTARASFYQHSVPLSTPIQHMPVPSMGMPHSVPTVYGDIK